MCPHLCISISIYQYKLHYISSLAVKSSTLSVLLKLTQLVVTIVVCWMQ